MTTNEKIMLLKRRMCLLQVKDPISNKNIIAKLARQIRALEG